MIARSTKRWWWVAALGLGVAVAAFWLHAATETAATADPVTEDETAEEQVDLETPFPQPVQVFVQKTSAFGSRGNVLLSVALDAAGIERLAQEQERADFLTIESDAGLVLLRDDGRGGDAAAGDGLFTTLATVDEQELANRAQEDQDAIAEEEAEKAATGDESAPQVLHFDGRSLAGSSAPAPFDYEAFSSGARVPLDQAVVFTEEPVADASQTTVELVTSEGRAELATAAATFTCSNAPTPSPGVTSLFQDRALMIRTVSVVEDATRTFNPCDPLTPGNPNGVWTFKHLMTEMANQPLTGIDPSVLTEQWLEQWLVTQTVNGDLVPARTQMQAILDQWPRIGGKLDLSRSPLRLLAIVPRVDLRRTTGGGGGYGAARTGKFLDAGELRFIFGVVLPPGWDETGFVDVQPIANEPGCRALPFTVIFEFGVPACDCPTVRDWAKRWVELASFTPGTNGYNKRLHRLTESVVRRNADPLDPNGSALNQLRTNEVALIDVTGRYPNWELREFQLTQKGFSLLDATTVADTPADAFNNTLPFKSWVENNVRPALADCESPIPPVPLFFQGNTFLGGKSQVPEANPALITFFWDAPSLNYADPQTNWARHRASRAACSGCHRRETFTDFVHVDPNHPGTQAVLPVPISTFLSGINYLGDPGQANNAGLAVSNPNNGLPKRHFDDLLRREDDVVKVSQMRCAKAAVVNAALVRESLAVHGVLPDDPFQGVDPGKAASLSPDDVLSNVISEVH